MKRTVKYFHGKEKDYNDNVETKYLIETQVKRKNNMFLQRDIRKNTESLTIDKLDKLKNVKGENIDENKK